VIHSFDASVVPVILFLALANMLLPYLACRLDRQALQKISDDREDCIITEEFLVNIASKRGDVYEKVIYSRDNYKDYADLEAPSFMGIAKLCFRHIYPAISFFVRFDFETKRLARYMIMSLPSSLVAIISAAFFRSFRLGEERGLDDRDVIAGVVVGVVLSVLMLPPPAFITGCLKSKIRVKPKRGQDKQLKPQPFEGGEPEPR